MLNKLAIKYNIASNKHPKTFIFLSLLVIFLALALSILKYYYKYLNFIGITGLLLLCLFFFRCTNVSGRYVSKFIKCLNLILEVFSVISISSSLLEYNWSRDIDGLTVLIYSVICFYLSLINSRNYLKRLDFKIVNFKTYFKLCFKNFCFNYGYISIVIFLIIIILLNIIIDLRFHVNFLLCLYIICFFNQSSPEWFSGLGTLLLVIITLHKLFKKTKPGLRYHIDKNHVCIEVIDNSSQSGFALLKHLYVSDKDGNEIPYDFISLYQNDTYSEPFGGNNRALIYLKRGKNDDRLRDLIDMSKSFKNQSRLRGYHYIKPVFLINDHIKPICRMENINKLSNLRWRHDELYYKKKNREQKKHWEEIINKYCSN